MLSIVKRFAVCHAGKMRHHDDGIGEEELKIDEGVQEFMGKKVESDYCLRGEIGFPGSFGKVMCCVNKRSHKSCAVKIMRVCHVVASAVDMEIEIMKQLEHESIIKTQAVYRDKKRVCIVMEKCDGGDLFDAVVERRFRSERQLASVVGQILSGLDHIHKLGIVHCDVKLANLLLTDKTAEPGVKIIDFGVSQYKKECKLRTAPVGSPSFIAPEILQGSYDEKADMWSLGVVVFILLFGFNPFNPKARSSMKYREKINAHIVKGFSNKTKKGRGAFFPQGVNASENAKDFVASLLLSDTELRMSASDALNHPWIERPTTK